VRLVPSGRTAEFLATWPVTELPIPQEMAERLMQFGLRTCGDCAAVTMVDLQRQFGPDGILLHRLCRGLDSAWIDPWREPPPCGVRRVLAGGVEDSESLRFGAAELARGLAQELSRQGRAAGRIRLILRGEDGSQPLVDQKAWWGEVAPPAPMATAEELLGPLLNLFRQARPQAPVGVVEVQAFDLVAPPVSQVGLWQGRAANREVVQRAVERLHDRFGRGLVWRVEVRPGHLGDVPEERLVWSSR
jgi:nucleotidyltransferase/DNA polymerase involved in DNA repair